VFHRHVNQYSRTKIAGIACSATDLGDSVPVELAAQLEKTGTLRAHGLAPNWHKAPRFWCLLYTETRRLIQAFYRSNTLQRKGSREMYRHGRVENVFSTGEHSTALHRVTIAGERMYYRVRFTAAQSIWVISSCTTCAVTCPVAWLNRF
jgi:hypothetical protein